MQVCFLELNVNWTMTGSLVKQRLKLGSGENAPVLRLYLQQCNCFGIGRCGFVRAKELQQLGCHAWIFGYVPLGTCRTGLDRSFLQPCRSALHLRGEGVQRALDRRNPGAMTSWQMLWGTLHSISDHVLGELSPMGLWVPLAVVSQIQAQQGGN